VFNFAQDLFFGPYRTRLSPFMTMGLGDRLVSAIDLLLLAERYQNDQQQGIALVLLTSSQPLLTVLCTTEAMQSEALLSLVVVEVVVISLIHSEDLFSAPNMR